MKKLFLTVCMMGGMLSALAQATLTEKVMDLPTYPFSDPTPVATPSNPIYPYFRYDGFSANKVTQGWKVVELENPYIKVSLLPEVGGKVWGAVDKTTNKEFLYQNHVIKFRDIAMRGPWTSGGIEFNFGIIGHVPSTANPVDYTTEKKADGSVSCYVSSYEWVTATWWTVEVNLPADKAYFTTNTTWHNTSAVEQPYYQWMNAGYSAKGNAHFMYPGTNYIGHGGEAYNFPIDPEGHDLSWYEKNNFGGSKSEHVLGKYNDFYGIYWEDNNYGSVHHSKYADKLGMKIFLWSLARDGGIWEDLLTDNDGQYIELQSGRMFNQPATNSAYTPFKHTIFDPQATDKWTEYWFPVKDTRGIVKTSPVGALNVLREDGKVKLYLSPLQKLNTEMKLYEGCKLVQTLPLQTEVLKTWEGAIPATGNLATEGKLKVVIGNNELVYSEVPEDNITNRPLETPKDFDWNTAYGLYLQGAQWMNQKYNDKAEDFLKQSLAKEPYLLPALTKLATLYYREGRYTEGVEVAKTALSVNTYDGEANYTYGLLNQALGNAVAAKDGFSIASRAVAVRSAAYEKLAEMYMAEGDVTVAEEFAHRALVANASNYSAQTLLLTIYRKTNQSDKAAALIANTLKEVPLYHPVRYEAYKAGKMSKEEFTSKIVNEFANEVYMELAGWYESIHATEEALELLACIKDYPIANYRKAYILHKQGKEDDAVAAVLNANEQSAKMVFPHRPSTLCALQWADSHVASWKTKYYQALILWSNQQPAAAAQLLSQCDDADYSPVFLSRATMKQGEERLADLKKAEKLEKSWRAGYALISYYIEKEEWANAAATGKMYMKLYPSNYYIGLKYAKALCECGQYATCATLIKNMKVLPNEGASAGRQVYRTASLYQAIDLVNAKRFKAALKPIEQSMVWPENLGVGKPYDNLIDARLEYYLHALALEGSGDADGAKAMLERVATVPESVHSFKSGNVLTALALKKLGKTAEADQYVASWKGNANSQPAIDWCKAVYNGDKDKINAVGKSNETEATPWEKSYRDSDLDLIIRLFKKK